MRSGPQYFNIRFHNQGMEIGYERVFITDHIAALACGPEEPATGRFSPTRASALVGNGGRSRPGADHTRRVAPLAGLPGCGSDTAFRSSCSAGA